MSEAAEHNKKIAVKVLSDSIGCTEEFATNVYDCFLSRFAKPSFYIKLSKGDAEKVMTSDSWFIPAPINSHEYEIFKAMGSRQGLMDAIVSSKMPYSGDLIAELRDLGGKAFVVCGSLERATDPSREDFVEHPKNIVFEIDEAGHAMAAQAVLELGKECQGMSPEEIAAMRADDTVCKVIIAAPLSRKNVRMFGVSTESADKWTKDMLRQAGVLCPVVAFEQDPAKRNMKLTGDHGARLAPHAKMSYFEIGDSVCRKPVAAESTTGKIIGVTPSEVLIDWPGERERLPLIEALSQICHIPTVLEENDGLDIYSMPGLSEEASEVINASGLDCVALYSILTNSGPIAETEIGWENRVVGSLKRAGIEARPVKGLVYSPTDNEAFVKKAWIECDLPEGRLVLDLAPSKISILSPDEDYLSFDEKSRPELD